MQEYLILIGLEILFRFSQFLNVDILRRNFSFSILLFVYNNTLCTRVSRIYIDNWGNWAITFQSY